MRRSLVRPGEAKRHLLLSPYRCVACAERFWVVSRRAKATALSAAIVAAFLATGVAAVRAWPEMSSGTYAGVHNPPAQRAPAAASPTDASAGLPAPQMRTPNDPSS